MKNFRCKNTKKAIVFSFFEYSIKKNRPLAKTVFFVWFCYGLFVTLALVLSFGMSLAFMLTISLSLAFVLTTGMSLALVFAIGLSLALVFAIGLSLALVLAIGMSLALVLATGLSLTFVLTTGMSLAFVFSFGMPLALVLGILGTARGFPLTAGRQCSAGCLVGWHIVSIVTQLADFLAQDVRIGLLGIIIDGQLGRFHVIRVCFDSFEVWDILFETVRTFLAYSIGLDHHGLGGGFLREGAEAKDGHNSQNNRFFHFDVEFL